MTTDIVQACTCKMPYWEIKLFSSWQSIKGAVNSLDHNGDGNTDKIDATFKPTCMCVIRHCSIRLQSKMASDQMHHGIDV